VKTLTSTLCLLLLAAGSLGQDTPPAETVGRLGQSAQTQLARATADLTALREQIQTEKLPLAQELTTHEEQVASLRKENDKVTRLVAEGNLGIATLKAGNKARQDELSYVANLLDEYARTFESKLNVCELQPFGQAVLDAKQATENDTLSQGERFGKQLTFVDVSVKRLFDAIGGLRFPGVGVDLQGSVLQGTFALVGPVALFRAATGVAGLVVPQVGSDKPLIRPLEGSLQTGLSALVADGDGTLPFDPSRGGALKALVQKTNLVHIFVKGGPIMWPLLIASILSMATVIERLIFLTNERRKRDRNAVEKVFHEVQAGNMAAAVAAGTGSQDFVARALGQALQHRDTSLAGALLYEQQQALKRYRRGIPILDTVITVAPLLGLLGTVTGMMGSFSLIGGDLGAPGAITGGIAEALIATAFGLGIAITSLLPFNFLNARQDEARHELESASAQLELLAHPSPVIAPPAPTPSHTHRPPAPPTTGRQLAGGVA
jgi:biopolymer transport protein ExbB